MSTSLNVASRAAEANLTPAELGPELLDFIASQELLSSAGNTESDSRTVQQVLGIEGPLCLGTLEQAVRQAVRGQCVNLSLDLDSAPGEGDGQSSRDDAANIAALAMSLARARQNYLKCVPPGSLHCRLLPTRGEERLLAITAPCASLSVEELVAFASELAATYAVLPELPPSLTGGETVPPKSCGPVWRTPSECGPNATIAVFDIPPGLASQVRGFAASHDLRDSCLFLAALVALTHRYTSQSEAHVEPGGLNIQLSPTSTALDLCRRIQAVNPAAAFGGTTADDAPASVSFQWCTLPQLSWRAGPVSFRLRHIHAGCRPERWDAALVVFTYGRTVICQLEYNCPWADSGFAARMRGHFLAALSFLASDSECTVGTFPMLSPHEMHDLLNAWNPMRGDYPAPAPILLHQLFEDQVSRTPDALAVTFESGNLTYQQLDTRANQMAHSLQRRGVTPGSCVGVCMENSLRLPAAVLGILKAGGACVPLDPHWPAERLASVLGDCGAHLLVTEQALRSLLTEYKGPLFLFDEDEVLNGECATKPESPVTEDDLAFVFYTSGSTGQPKGVMASHRSRGSRLCWELGAFSISGHDCHLLKASISAGVFVKEFLLPLASGGRIVIARSDRRHDFQYLTRLIAEQGVSVVTVVPTVLQLLLDEPGIENCKCIRHVLCGGENLSRQLLTSCLNRLSCLVHHTYGGSEISTASHNTYRPGDNPEEVSIGRPSDVRIYLLDIEGRVVPVGIPGEICVSGVGLALGYFGRPDLTAAVLTPDPFIDDPASRLYRSGDWARYLPDGNLVFLGRRDSMVKIRGNRVELGEVEAVVASHPRVKEAAVVLEDGTSGQYLIAYIVLRDGGADTGDLPSYLRSRLPVYMVPALEPLPFLPKSSIGKTDRRSLVGRRHAQPVPSAEDLPSLSPFQRQIANIWAEVFHPLVPDPRADFFALGGNSLIAVQIVARIRERLAVELPLDCILDHPTVESLSAAIEAELGTLSEVPPAPDDSENFLI
jgi:amino acid adenylation domain-containing protein